MTARGRKGPSTAVCVLGMHRSGTSLVTRVLNLLGLRLGPPEHLTRSRAHNARGYWEHQLLTDISDQVLASMGGTWHDPPDLPAGWESDPLLAKLRDRAREVLDTDFATSGLWGWKDPRLSLTLPFWRSLIGDVRYVVCVRNPVDVASSLDRNYSREGPLGQPYPFSRGVRLWRTYAAASVRETAGSPRLFVAYEDVLERPDREIRRLASFIGVSDAPEGDPRRRMVMAEIDRELQHHRTRAEEALADPRLDGATKELYAVLIEATNEDPGAAERLEEAVRRVPVASSGATRPVAAPLPASADRLRLSIAMCTFNGQQHLAEQLESIAAQSRTPDELVVSDDRSTDETAAMLERFRRTARFPVEVQVNEERLGSTKNFEQAIVRCRGDVILLADQDDLWRGDKLERIEREFRVQRGLGAVFTDADLIDDRSRSLDRRLWDALRVPEAIRARFIRGGPAERVAVLCRANLATGATLAFRARFSDLILPIPSAWVQDAWIVLLLSAVADVAMLPEPLVRYRLHSRQQIGVRGPGTMERLIRRTQVVRRLRKTERRTFVQQSNAFLLAYRRLYDGADSYSPAPEALAAIREKIDHSRARGEMGLASRRWRTVASELASGRYHRYSSGLGGAAKDLLLLDRG